MDSRENLAGIIGAVIAVLLQIIVAPNLALFGAMPNFVAVYVVAVALARPQTAGPIMPFVLGLTYDLLGNGPVGAMAFLLVLVTLIASRAFTFLNNDTLFMPLLIIVVSFVAMEMLYAFLLIGLGLSVSPLDAFVYRAFPCALFDCVFGLILYPLLTRLFAGAQQSQQPGTPHLR